MSKLGCSTRFFVIAAIIVFALAILGLASGPIGQSKLSEILPEKWLPDKPMSGVKIEELEEGTLPAGLTDISYEELVRLGKDKEVDTITLEGKHLGITLKEQQVATLSVTIEEEITEHELVETLREDGVKVKESSPLAPEAIFGLFGSFSITNTILASWLTIIVLLILAYFATRKMKDIPTGLQNLMEALIEVMLSFVEGVAGKENGRRFFFIVGSIFLFVLTNAWLSLFPIFNSITYGGVAVFRGANTDINVPLAIALVSFVSVEYWGITAMGFRVYMKKFVRLSSLRQGKIVMGIVEAFVGVLEGISELIRLLSFTFRLFGNMTAGEILLLVSAFLIPFVFSTVFYGLELFIGLVQALIFAGLTLVFATTAVAGHSEEAHADEEHAEAKK